MPHKKRLFTLALALAVLLTLGVPAWAATNWYVRPFQAYGYGDNSGTCYDNAWPGMGIEQEITEIDISGDKLRINTGTGPVFDACPIWFHTTGMLPAPLAPDTLYYAENWGAGWFMVTATKGGPTIDITDAGSGTYYVMWGWNKYIIQPGDTIYVLGTEYLGRSWRAILPPVDGITIDFKHPDHPTERGVNHSTLNVISAGAAWTDTGTNNVYSIGQGGTPIWVAENEVFLPHGVAVSGRTPTVDDLKSFEAGSWYVYGGLLYVKSANGNPPSTNSYRVYGAANINLSNRSNITLKNPTIYVGNIYFTGSSNCTIDGPTIYLGGILGGNGTNNNTLKNFYIRYVGGGGVYLTGVGTGNIIEDGEVWDALPDYGGQDRHGIAFQGGSKNTVRRNKIYNCSTGVTLWTNVAFGECGGDWYDNFAYNMYAPGYRQDILFMTRSNPCIIYWKRHQLCTRGTVTINLSGITQAKWSALNGTHKATWVDKNRLSIPVDTSGFAADYDPVTDPGQYYCTSPTSGQVMYGVGFDHHGGSQNDPVTINCHNNIAVNCHNFGYRFTQVYTSGGGYYVYNNVAYKCLKGFRIGEISQTNYMPFRYKNNIIAEPYDVAQAGRKPVFIWAEYNAACTKWDVQVDYNCYYPNADRGTPLYFKAGGRGGYISYAAWKAKTFKNGVHPDAHSKTGDPKFVNGSGSYNLDTDFQLKPGSACFNAGVNVGLSQDYGGNPIVGLPDMGAYEYQFSVPPIKRRRHHGIDATKVN